MIKSEPFSCQWWSASDQQWVLNINNPFSELVDAVRYGKEHYKEFRVIEQGVVSYTRVYEDGVLIEEVGASALLGSTKGSTLKQAFARQAKREGHNRRASASVLENVSGELGAISLELSHIQYAARIMGYPALANDVKRQRSLLAIEIRRIDGIAHRLEADADVQDNS